MIQQLSVKIEAVILDEEERAEVQLVMAKMPSLDSKGTKSAIDCSNPNSKRGTGSPHLIEDRYSSSIGSSGNIVPKFPPA